jgi:hypothetical protein
VSDHDDCAGGSCCSWYCDMIYLSANGEILGEFDEASLQEKRADGGIPEGAFYWREGMAEWRPVEELMAAKLPPKPIRTPAAAPAALASELSLPIKPQAEQTVRPVAGQTSPQPVAKPKAPVVAAAPAAAVKPKAKEGPASATPIAAKVAPLAVSSPAPGPVVDAPSPDPAPARAPSQAPKEPVAAGALRPVSEAQWPGPEARPRRRWLVVVLLVLLLGALAAGGAWWWMGEAKPPEIAGSVVLPAGVAGPVEVRVYRRGDLATPWGEFLATADARAAELGALIADAEGVQRENELLLEEASRVHEVGVEYNMPDVEELKTERDAREAEFAEAQAAVRKLQAEQEGLFEWGGLLGVLPAPLRTATADEMGDFTMMRPGEDEVVLLAVGREGDGEDYLCWMAAVEALTPDASLTVVEFSEAQRLDLEAVRRVAAGEF